MEKYKQELPKDVEGKLDAYIERIKAISWFKPKADLNRAEVDTKVSASLETFGLKASIEYRKLSTPADWDAARGAAWDAAWGAARGAARDAAWDAARDAAWDAAWDAARDAAWDAARGAARGAAWDAAWGAAETLVKDLPAYKGKCAFLTLVDLYEIGLYPVGLINGKFVVYVPPCAMQFPEQLTEK